MRGLVKIDSVPAPRLKGFSELYRLTAEEKRKVEEINSRNFRKVNGKWEPIPPCPPFKRGDCTE